MINHVMLDSENGCYSTKRRIHLRKFILNTMLCLEVDANQHKRHIKSAENNKHDDVFMDFSGNYKIYSG
jgi:hypothetical protein